MPDSPDGSPAEPQPTADAPTEPSASPAAEGTRLPGADAEPLDERTAARWDTARSALGALAGRITDESATADDFAATRGQLDALDLDLAAVRDALHVPADAGPHRDGLERILRRIPDGWGRWISCGPGWYPLLVDLEAELAAIDPDHVIHQVKEKFGSLRVYASLSGPARSGSRGGSDDTPPAFGPAAADLPVSDPAANEPEVAAARFQLAIHRAEALSAQTCELTGRPGRLMVRDGWCRTLDPDRFTVQGWTLVGGASDDEPTS